MKKYLFGALALPLLFACSSEDFDEKVVSNDQFAGIAKVDATFSMDGAFTRFDGKDGTGVATWNPQEGDLWGFAWMGGAPSPITITGDAYQNHNLIQKGNYFEPQTSIYVGNYYIYRPYDETTVNVGRINFNSLVDQPLAEGYESAKQPWKDLAKTAINIGDKWTTVTTGGTYDPSTGKTWDKAGIKQNYKLYAAIFSNQTGLDLTYTNNNPKFKTAKTITGATDINLTYAAGTEVGAADIYEATVNLAGQAQSFTYAPTVEPNTAAHINTFWASKSNLAAVTTGTPGDGFAFTAGAITLTPADAENGLSTGADGNKAWFWFNSLPVTAGGAGIATTVQATFTTSYGVVTTNSTVGASAYAFDYPTATAAAREWIKLTDAVGAAADPTKWDVAAHNTFINQYGNHKGKYALTVDFEADGVMNNMHIKNDAHLQKLLKFYIASGKTENVTLNLDANAAGEFKLSKISIALLQTINASATKVLVQACGTHGTPKIIVTQEGCSASETEVPDLNKVFAASTNVYLASGTNWTWKERPAIANYVTVDANVASLTNEGTLTVNATNIQLSTGINITNAANGTMNITKVTTVKNNLINNGTINVGDASNTSAELRAYNATITNDATSLTAYGTINNYGVVGKSAGTSGKVDNYGYINMMDANAITLLRTNEKNNPANATAPAPGPYGPFHSGFVAGTNMMGTVVLPEGNPYALVSVSNTDETGFIKYNWTAATYSHDAGNVKYNTIVVSNNIEFTGGAFNPATEIKFIEFNGTRTQVVNPAASDKLPNLKGVIVNPGMSFILEKTNVLDCHDGAFLGAGATIYRGGDFLCNGVAFAAAQTNNYLGTWSLDQIVEW